MHLSEALDHKERVLPKFVMDLDVGQTHPCFLTVSLLFLSNIRNTS